MPTEVYKQLLEVMKKRGGPMAGMDIPEFFDMVEEQGLKAALAWRDAKFAKTDDIGQDLRARKYD